MRCCAATKLGNQCTLNALAGHQRCRIHEQLKSPCVYADPVDELTELLLTTPSPRPARAHAGATPSTGEPEETPTAPASADTSAARWEAPRPPGGATEATTARVEERLHALQELSRSLVDPNTLKQLFDVKDAAPPEVLKGVPRVISVLSQGKADMNALFLARGISEASNAAAQAARKRAQQTRQEWLDFTRENSTQLMRGGAGWLLESFRKANLKISGEYVGSVHENVLDLFGDWQTDALAVPRDIQGCEFQVFRHMGGSVSLLKRFAQEDPWRIISFHDIVADVEEEQQFCMDCMEFWRKIEHTLAKRRVRFSLHDLMELDQEMLEQVLDHDSEIMEALRFQITKPWFGPAGAFFTQEDLAFVIRWVVGYQHLKSSLSHQGSEEDKIEAFRLGRNLFQSHLDQIFEHKNDTNEHSEEHVRNTHRKIRSAPHTFWSVLTYIPRKLKKFTHSILSSPWIAPVLILLGQVVRHAICLVSVYHAMQKLTNNQGRDMRKTIAMYFLSCLLSGTLSNLFWMMWRVAKQKSVQQDGWIAGSLRYMGNLFPESSFLKTTFGSLAAFSSIGTYTYLSSSISFLSAKAKYLTLFASAFFPIAGVVATSGLGAVQIAAESSQPVANILDGYNMLVHLNKSPVYMDWIPGIDAAKDASGTHLHDIDADKWRPAFITHVGLNMMGHVCGMIGLKGTTKRMCEETFGLLSKVMNTSALASIVMDATLEVVVWQQITALHSADDVHTWIIANEENASTGRSCLIRMLRSTGGMVDTIRSMEDKRVHPSNPTLQETPYEMSAFKEREFNRRQYEQVKKIFAEKLAKQATTWGAWAKSYLPG